MEWISVKKNLPYFGDTVDIVVRKYGSFCRITDCIFSEEPFGFLDWSEDGMTYDWYEVDGDYCTHWMYPPNLPEPPKGDNDE